MRKGKKTWSRKCKERVACFLPSSSFLPFTFFPFFCSFFFSIILFPFPKVTVIQQHNLNDFIITLFRAFSTSFQSFFPFHSTILSSFPNSLFPSFLNSLFPSFTSFLKWPLVWFICTKYDTSFSYCNTCYNFTTTTKLFSHTFLFLFLFLSLPLFLFFFSLFQLRMGKMFPQLALFIALQT